MTDAPFSAGRAATHFLSTEGPRGFLLRFALVYALLSLVLQVISGWVSAPIYAVYLRVFTEGGGDLTPYMDEINAASGQANLTSLALLPVSLALWVVFEAASQRRYIRADGFGLRLGADEGRLAIVGMIWFALLIAAYFALALAALIPGVIAGLVAGAVAGFAVGGIALTVGLVATTWLFARLSAASALTIRDQQIRFFESWTLTRGHGWSLTSSYLILFLVIIVVSLIVYGALFLLAFVLLFPVIGTDPDAVTSGVILAEIAKPGFWGPMALAMFLVLLVFGVFTHALGGPPALLVRRRTDEGGMTITDTFA
jgi:hypothetical protein